MIIKKPRATSYATQQRDVNNYVKHLELQLEQTEQQQQQHEESSLEQHPLEASLQNLSIDDTTEEDDESDEGESNLADTQELLSMSMDDSLRHIINEPDTRELLELEPTNDLFDSLTNFPSNEP